MPTKHHQTENKLHLIHSIFGFCHAREHMDCTKFRQSGSWESKPTHDVLILGKIPAICLPRWVEQPYRICRYATDQIFKYHNKLVISSSFVKLSLQGFCFLWALQKDISNCLLLTQQPAALKPLKKCMWFVVWTSRKISKQMTRKLIRLSV